jgi:hypothetical protein
MNNTTQTKVNHTQGEWKVDEGNSHLFIVSGENEIANIPKDIDTPIETLANAKLIAAAPDLLDAAQSVLDTLDAMVQDSMIEGMSMVLKAAINKATK